MSFDTDRPGAKAPGLQLSGGIDSLWEGGPAYRQAEGVFPLSSDTAWLGEFIRLSGVKRFCDLGCGGGALSLQLLGRKPSLIACGMDILPEAVRSAEDNLRLNGWTGEYYCGDLRDWKVHFRPGSFDLVVTNPPYYPRSGGTAAGERGTARTERCTVSELCEAASGLLHEGGRFCAVYPPFRLGELLTAMTAARLEPKRLQLVMKNVYKEPCAVLAEGIRNGGTGLRILPPILTEDTPCPENSI